MEKLLVEYITDFLEYCDLDRGLSPLTVKTYGYYLGQFDAWLSSEDKPLQPSQLSEEFVRQYRQYLSRYVNPVTGPLSKSTQNFFLIVLRAFLRFLAKRGIRTISAEQIELAKGRDRSLKFLDNSQLERLLITRDVGTDEGLRDRTILELLFSTGLRVSELIKLNRDQINLRTREFGIIGKGGRARVIFISTRAAGWLSRYLTTRHDSWKPLFIHYSGKKDESPQGELMRLTARSVQRMVSSSVKKAGLPVKATPHTLRHSFATDLLRNGADLRSVQELLGHKNVATTQIYTHVTNSQLREVFQKFHDKS